MVHSLKKKNQGGNAILKLTWLKHMIEKINETFDSKFLLGMVFHTNFGKLVSMCVTSPWYLVMMNGFYKGFFQAE